MNDLLERYLGAVCSYFEGPKKQHVYAELKQQIQESVHQYDDLEDLLINYGHPRSLALSFGYRPWIQHIFNPKIISFIEKAMLTIAGIYLFFSTLYYLYELGCLPFLPSYITTTLQSSTIMIWLLSYPYHVIIGIIIISMIILIYLDHTHRVNQEVDFNWSVEELYNLPHQSHYASHMSETIYMIIFCIYFLIYTIFFNQDIIMQIQHTSYKMIHLMTYFFQPFTMIIVLDYMIDITKRIYTRKYLKYSSAINLFTIIALSLFIYNSHFLADYLLPFDVHFNYILVNIFIIGALFMILSISIYKLFRNLKSYKSSFKK